MLVTNREDILARALVLRDHGRNPGDKMFFNTEVAYKYKMSGMQAALGLAQLERIDNLVARKRQIFEWYRNELEGVKGLTLNFEAPQTKNTYWMVTVVLDPRLGLKKEDLMDRLGEQGIDTRPFFHPLSSIPAYRDLEQARQARQRNRVTYAISPFGINLPSALNLTPQKVGYVCDRVKAIVRESENSRLYARTRSEKSPIHDCKEPPR